MSSGKKFKKPPPLPLSLPTNTEEPDWRQGCVGINDGIMCPPPPVLGPTFGTSGPSPLLQTIEDLVITDVDDEQRKRMKLFFDKKKQLGELKSEEDFEKMAELGAGNGGVVHCVRHISTGTVIAKKMIHLEVKQGFRKIANLL